MPPLDGLFTLFLNPKDATHHPSLLAATRTLHFIRDVSSSEEASLHGYNPAPISLPGADIVTADTRRKHPLLQAVSAAV